LTGQSSNPCAIDVFETLPHWESCGYWIARSSRAMTAKGAGKAGRIAPGDDSAQPVN
jgi:hypothetical protein